MHVELATIIRHLPGAIILLIGSAFLSTAQERDRSKIEEQYKWDLTAVYPSDQAWQDDKEKLTAELPKLLEFKGTLASSPQRMADALEIKSRMEKQLTRLFVYASMMSDQDTRVSTYQGMQQAMIQLASTFGAESAYFEPEILKMDKGNIEQFITKEPRLGAYKHYLEDISRRREHTGTDAEEKLLAGAAVMASAPSSIYSLFSNADFPYPTVVLSDGKTVKLDKAAFSLNRASRSRDDRQKVMATFFNALGTYRGTFGSMLNSSVQASVYYAQARHYKTTLEASLDANNIPTAVYSRLIEGVDRNLPTFHRYLKLRKRMMGLKDLHYYDLYAPLVASVDKEYPVEEARRNILAALAPLGPEYAAGAKRAFSERWIDLYPSEGKTSGAFSNGEAYDVHPYMLLNYNRKYDDVSTLAHELGHTMHSYFSNKTQPYPTASYPIFVAEVASTFNEALLIDSMLKTIKDDATRLSLLGNYLESIKGTVFRQTQFAEFELRMHEMVEKGEPLTGDALSKLYSDIVKKYYGHDQGVCIVHDYVANEWAFIPHFYNDYYVFQYATSFTASSALSEKVLAGEPGATARYLKFISSGRSKYPIELLKDAGVDMTTGEPLDLTVKKMNQVMDEMEKLLEKTAQTTAGK
ncbi:MAG: oligoendopeptidase F [Terriglobales bacterium]